MEVRGTITRVFETHTYSNERGDFAFQEFELEFAVGKEGRSKAYFQIKGQDRINRLNVKEGQEVDVYVFIEGREHNGKHYNSVYAWDVRPVAQASTEAPSATAAI